MQQLQGSHATALQLNEIQNTQQVTSMQERYRRGVAKAARGHTPDSAAAPTVVVAPLRLMASTICKSSALYKRICKTTRILGMEHAVCESWQLGFFQPVKQRLFELEL